MFFGIFGCPSPDDSAPNAITSSIATKPSVGIQTAGIDSASPVPEPITLVLLGSGLVALGVIGRKNFKK
jgi:hypothetical protein